MGYLSTLPDGRIVKVNRTFCAWTGRSADDLLGVAVPGPADRRRQGLPRHPPGAAAAHAGGGAGGRARRRCAPTARCCRAWSTPSSCATRTAAAVLVRATLFEATARRRYERELLAAQRAAQESEARSRIVQQVVSDLAAATSAEDVATVIVERSRAALDARGAALVLVEERARRPGRAARPASRCARWACPVRCWRRCGRRRAGSSRWSWRRASGRCRWTSGCGRRSPGWPRRWPAAGLARLVIVPVTADSRRLGVLILGLGHGGAGRPDQPRGAGRAPGPRAGRDRAAVDHRPAGRAGAGAGAAARADRPAGRARRVPAGRRAAAGRGRRTSPTRWSGWPSWPWTGWPTSASSTWSPSRARSGPRRGTATRPASTWPTRCGSGTCRSAAATHPSTRALQQGGTQWVRAVDDAFLAAVTSDERHLEAIRALQLTSVVAVPLIAEGRRLGVLTLATDRRRAPFTAADVEVAEQLGLQVSLVARQGAALRARRPDVAHPAGQPAAAAAARRSPGCRRRCATWRRRRAWRSAATSTTSSGCRTARWRWRSGTSSATTSPPRRRWASCNSVYRALLVDGPSPSAMIDRLQAELVAAGPAADGDGAVRGAGPGDRPAGGSPRPGTCRRC